MRNMARLFSQLFAAAAMAFAVVAVVAPAIAAGSARDADALADASYLYIATVRKDGNQSTAARVWFIATPDGQILFDTNTDSWKAKRIARGSPVIVWIGSATGPAFIGKAEFVRDPQIQDQMIEAIPKKYWLARLGYSGPSARSSTPDRSSRFEFFPSATCRRDFSRSRARLRRR
jgi:general stress protein 26